MTHNVARFQVPTTQVEHGWMNDSALSLIDLETLTLKATLLLDEPTCDAANPWAVTWTADEHRLCVAHSGSHELSVIGVQALFEKLADATPGRLIDNLTFLEGVRQRVPLTGNGPRCLVVTRQREPRTTRITRKQARTERHSGGRRWHFAQGHRKVTRRNQDLAMRSRALPRILRIPRSALLSRYR